MIAGTPRPVPFETEGLGSIGCRLALRGDGAWTNFRTRGVVHLHALPRQTRRTAERLRAGDHFSRNLGPPGRQIIGHFKLNRHILNSSDFSDELRKQTGPTARSTAKDHLQRFALTLVRTLVDEDTHRCRRARPDIAGESAKRHYIQARQYNAAVVSLSDVPSKNTFTVTVRRRLGKVAGTRNAALAGIEPIPLDTPLRNIRHGVLRS